MNAARVSVIVPCYNLGRYLDEAIGSVFTQTFQDFEIVIVDDGSTDEETRRLLASYERPRTRLVRSANRGLPAAKNLGLAHTTGPYVCMFDADDRLDPAMLEKSVAALDSNPSLTFVSHWLRTFGDEVWEWTPASCDAPALLDVNTVNGAALVRRSALEAVGGFDESMRDGCEDWDLWIGLIERGFKGAILPEVLFHYRRRPDSMSRLMMRGDGHPRLYRRLVEKHPRIYREHLPALLLRREEDISNLRRHTHDMELEEYRWLGPELAKWRDDVAMLERKAERVERDRQREQDRANLEAALQRAESDRREMADRLAEERAARARAEAERDQISVEQDRVRIERDRIEAGRERAIAERDLWVRHFDDARAKALDLDASVNRARDAVDALHRSVSWRATAPLRAVYATIRRILGRNGS